MYLHVLTATGQCAGHVLRSIQVQENVHMNNQPIAQGGSVFMRIVEHENKRYVQIKLEDVLIQLEPEAAFALAQDLIQTAWNANNAGT